MYKKYNIQIGDKVINKYGDTMEVIDILPKHRLLIKFNNNNNWIKNVKLYDFVDGKCKAPSTSKIGEQYITKQGYTITVIDYINCCNVKIRFNDERHTELICRYDSVYNGVVENPYHKTIMGIACLGNVDNIPRDIYEIWYHMIQRCYTRTESTEAYKDCTVSDEWLCFENFLKWYNDNYYECEELLELDKDILKAYNKVYCKENCLLVPHNINILLKANRLTSTQGYHKELHYGHIYYRVTNKNFPYKRFKNEYDARMYYKRNMLIYLRNQILKYTNKIPQKILDKILNSDYLKIFETNY